MAGSRHATLVAFVDELAEVRRRCGSPSLNKLVAYSADLPHPLARSTISDKLNAKSLPDWDFVASFLAACHTHARRTGVPPPPDVVELDEWESRHMRLLSELDEDRRDQRLAIAAAQTRAAWSTPRQLPAAVRTFVGREAQLQALVALGAEATEASGAVVIAAIHGAAGIGTSALAVHAAHLLADRFPDGQLYVDLRGADPADAVRDLLEALAVPPERVPTSLAARVNVYRSLLADRRVLMLLDNADDADQVRPLLPATPGSLVLVAGRDQIAELIAREGAHAVPVAELTGEEAWRLLAGRVGEERVRTETSVLDLIISRCSRRPLALCGVAARASAEPTLPLATIARGMAPPRGRWRRIALAAVVAGAVVASVMLAGPRDSGASAGPDRYFVTPSNASDPYIVDCVNPATRRGGFCLYTSQDLGTGAPWSTEYPMDGTRVFWSESGTSWQDMGLALTGQLGPPAVARSADGSYYLFAPGASRIGVSRSAGPFGPFHHVDVVRVADEANQPTMADPAVFTSGDRRYLLWADGNPGACGGISIGELAPGMTRVSSRTAVRIDGVDGLGGCDRRAPALYDLAGMGSLPGRYTLIFTAKPASVPADCALMRLGHPGTANEVIAYATADAVTGPYTYRGIVMCGSATEWTNRATIAVFRTPGGLPRLVMIYHDGAVTDHVHNRKLRAECLMFHDGRILTTHRTPDGPGWCLSSPHIVALRSRPDRRFVAAQLETRDAYLYTNHERIGWWEQFELIDRGNGTVALRARNGRYVAPDRDDPGRALLADRDVVGGSEELRLIRNSDGSVSLQSVSSGRYVAADPGRGGRLLANRSGIPSWARFDLIDLYG